jgi:hypothetical protein
MNRLGILAVSPIRLARVVVGALLVCAEMRVTPWANGWRAVEAAKAAACLSGWDPCELWEMMGGNKSVAEVWGELVGTDHE